jgi:hypothetical protein
MPQKLLARKTKKKPAADVLDHVLAPPDSK